MASVLTKDKKSSGFVLVPRKEYKKLLDLEKTLKDKLSGVISVDSAIKIYLKEKKQKKLKVLKSLAGLD
ncbi:MAG: hypothetical protein Q8Q90_00490 [bacterium]|nr:hypothetical protein [bacterium]